MLAYAVKLIYGKPCGEGVLLYGGDVITPRLPTGLVFLRDDGNHFEPALIQLPSRERTAYCGVPAYTIFIRQNLRKTFLLLS